MACFAITTEKRRARIATFSTGLLFVTLAFFTDCQSAVLIFTQFKVGTFDTESAVADITNEQFFRVLDTIGAANNRAARTIFHLGTAPHARVLATDSTRFRVALLAVRVVTLVTICLI